MVSNQNYWFNSSLECLLKKTDQEGEIIPRIRTFLRRGGDINQRHSYGFSLLSVAKAKELDKVVKFLVINKALEQEQDNYFNIGKKISIFSKNPKFITKMQCALYILSRKETGHRLIGKIEKGGHNVVITESPSENECVFANRANAENREIGSPSTIHVTGNSTPGHPYYIVLGHELIHAMHASYGKVFSCSSNEVDRCVWSNNEEYNTIVGFPSKNPKQAKPKITDNALRREHHVRERSTHNGAVETANNFASSLFRSLPTQRTYSNGATLIRCRHRR